jgi:hypothetical protein
MSEVERWWSGPDGVFRRISQADREQVAELTEASPEVVEAQADARDLAILRELSWREYMTDAEVSAMGGEGREISLGMLLWSLRFVHHIQPAHKVRDYVLLEGHVNGEPASDLWDALLPLTDWTVHPPPCLTAVVIEALPRTVRRDQIRDLVAALPALPLQTPSPNPNDPLIGPWGEWVEVARKRVLSATHAS